MGCKSKMGEYESRQGKESGMGHAGDKGYGKTIQYDVEMWGEVLEAADNHKWSQEK
jgi:hypothetical protein